MEFTWPMLKAPSLNPWTYISRYYNIDQTEGHYFIYFWTNLGPMLVERIVISEYNQTYHTHTSCYYILDLLCVNIIRPKCCKSRISEDLTDIVIIGLAITL